MSSLKHLLAIKYFLIGFNFIFGHSLLNENIIVERLFKHKHVYLSQLCILCCYVSDLSLTLNLCNLAEAPVTFASPLKDTSVPESETATFTCEISKPDKKVTWYKNGKEIVPDEHFEVKVEGTVHTLKVKDIALDDTADYTVKLGEETSKAKLTVLGEYFLLFNRQRRL